MEDQILNSKQILNRMREHLQEVQATYDNDWFVICLQGSQNYGVSDAESDIDTKCLILPTFDQLIFNKPAISHTLVMDNDEHCDVKDIREYFKIVRKSNINFVEIFFTKWYIVNPKYEAIWDKLRANAEIIARINPYRALCAMRGMAYEKYHALEHNYPSRAHMIDKYGYDPKQLSHLLRIKYFMYLYSTNQPYKDCIYLQNSGIRDMIYRTKRDGWQHPDYTYKELAESLIETIENIYEEHKDDFPQENSPTAEYVLNSCLEEIMRQSLREELKV